MSTEENKNASQPAEGAMPAAETGNASNPSPQNGPFHSTSDNQLLGEKAEKYLRESGTIEDMPDAQESEEMNETLKQSKGDQ